MLRLIDVCRLSEAKVDSMTNTATSKDTTVIVLDGNGVLEPLEFFCLSLGDFKTLKCKNSGESFKINRGHFNGIKRVNCFVHNFCIKNKIKDKF